MARFRGAFAFRGYIHGRRPTGWQHRAIPSVGARYYVQYTLGARLRLPTCAFRIAFSLFRKRTQVLLLFVVMIMLKISLRSNGTVFAIVAFIIRAFGKKSGFCSRHLELCFYLHTTGGIIFFSSYF